MRRFYGKESGREEGNQSKKLKNDGMVYRGKTWKEIGYLIKRKENDMVKGEK